MTEPTDEMGAALLAALPPDARWGWRPDSAKSWLADVLAIVERDQAAERQRLADVLEAVNRAMATDSRDWGMARGDAWLYGVLVGWECDDQHEHNEIDCGGALDEMAIRHGWTTAHVDRIRALRRAIYEASPP